MTLKIDLGPYSDIEYIKISEWIIRHIVSDQRSIVALQFPDSDVKYAPRIQYFLENEINKQLRIKEKDENTYSLKFVVLCDILTPSCCIDKLNIKKSHSNLLIHFGYCCYYNLKQINIPILFVRPKPNFLYNKRLEYNTCHGIIDFIFKNIEKYTIYDQNKISKLSVIISFQDIFYSNLSNDLTNAIKSSNTGGINNSQKIFFYYLSHIENNDTIFKETEFICDLSLIKLCHENDLKIGSETFLLDSNKSLKNKIFFFHFFAKNYKTSSFLERIYLRYNELINISICEIHQDGHINLNDNYINYLSALISKRFVFIEKSLSVQGLNRVGFIITPGITEYEWQLINYYKKFKYRKNVDNDNKIYIESHIIALTGVSEVKLRNFSNIEIFCYFGCNEYFITHIVKNLNLKYPIILTPYEYEVYLGIRKWTPTFLSTFDLYNSLIKESEILVSSTDSELSEVDIEFSLLIKEIQSSQKDQVAFKSNSNIQKLDPMTKRIFGQLHKTKFELQKTYFGLDPIHSTERIPHIVQGRSGIASSYLNESNL